MGAVKAIHHRCRRIVAHAGGAEEMNLGEGAGTRLEGPAVECAGRGEQLHRPIGEVLIQPDVVGMGREGDPDCGESPIVLVIGVKRYAVGRTGSEVVWASTYAVRLK